MGGEGGRDFSIQPKVARQRTLNHFTKPLQRPFFIEDTWQVLWYKVLTKGLSVNASSLDLQKMGEETATTVAKMDVFIVQWEHQEILGDPSDPSRKHRNKRQDEPQQQTTEGLNTDCLLFQNQFTSSANF